MISFKKQCHSSLDSVGLKDTYSTQYVVYNKIIVILIIFRSIIYGTKSYNNMQNNNCSHFAKTTHDVNVLYEIQLKHLMFDYCQAFLCGELKHLHIEKWYMGQKKYPKLSCIWLAFGSWYLEQLYCWHDRKRDKKKSANITIQLYLCISSSASQ